ncbi:SnoaL-like domain-containing protein [Sphingobium faniae]|nr:SnoaL-like domain-containing protein [Sphingobium faniae]
MDLTGQVAALAAQVRALQDLMEIRRLKSQYVKCNDGGWPGRPTSHMGSMDELFVEDGIWDGRPALPMKAGRASIKDWVESELRAVPFAIHNVMNDFIEVDGDTARGTWQYVLMATMPDGEHLGFSGNYHETYVRTLEGWRFQTIRAETTRIWRQEQGWGAAPSEPAAPAS